MDVEGGGIIRPRSLIPQRICCYYYYCLDLVQMDELRGPDAIIILLLRNQTVSSFVWIREYIMYFTYFFLSNFKRSHAIPETIRLLFGHFT